MDDRSQDPVRVLSLALALAAALPGRSTAAEPAWVCLPDPAGTWQCRRAEGDPMAARIQAAPAAPAGAHAPPLSAERPTPGRSAAPEPAQCGALAPIGPVGADLPPGQVRIAADATAGTRERFELEGNVQILRAGQSLQADRVIYDQAADRAEAEGNVVFRQPGLEVESASGYTEIEGEQAAFRDSRYRLPERNARGEAARMERRSPTQARLEEATYTTCPPQRRDWVLQAEQVDLDQAAGVGKARDVAVRFKGVPIFYTPRLTFPIDDQRKSGFLLPSAGSSDESGVDVAIPYYWNIAPNRDATITPRILGERGLQLNGEYRYLTPRSRGEFGIEFLPDDDLYGDDRSLFSYRHNGRFGAHWTTDVYLSAASDDEYFQDLGQSLSLASTTHLERRIDLRYVHGPWYLLGRVQDFQAIGVPESYSRMPQLIAATTLPGTDPRLTFHFYGEAVRFDHPDAGVTTGTRLDLKPGVSYDWRGAAWFLRPTASVRHTAYQLEDPAAGSPEDPSRTTPIVSLDGGLFFERDTRLGNRPMLHTLEPRLFYLYVPYEDQSDIPVFDTGRLDFSFAQLFRDNRFSGADRQSAANQLTAALTSRLLHADSGRERVRASIGQIYYFRDRDVTLPGMSPESENSSSVVAELGLQLWAHSSFTAGVQYDPHDSATERSSVLYRYQGGPRRIFNLGYRFRENDIEQTDLAFIWPVSARWAAIGRWNYSIRDELTLEAFAGLEYDACCWTVRVVARNYVNEVGGETNTAFYVQFLLKGLTSIGTGLDALLERGILGYGRETPLQ